jgi:N-dimethylarginine dimethylaminohydrolase
VYEYMRAFASAGVWEAIRHPLVVMLREPVASIVETVRSNLGIELIHAWPTETMAVNCLAVRPGRVIIAEGCPRTVERLNSRGAETVEIPYAEVYKNGGGIHCSTMPLIRDAE